jgi:hypothetical protein
LYARDPNVFCPHYTYKGSTGIDVVTRQQRYVVMWFAETFFSVATYHVVFAPPMVAFAPSSTVVAMLPSLDLVVKLLSGLF